MGASFVYDTFGRPKKVIPDRGGDDDAHVLPCLRRSRSRPIGEHDRGSADSKHDVRPARTSADLPGAGPRSPACYSAMFTDYDAAGRVARVSRPTVPTPSAPTEAWKFTSFDYDAASRPTSHDLPCREASIPAAFRRTPGQVFRTYDWLSATDFHFDRVGDATARLIRTTTVDARGDVVSTANTDPDAPTHVATTTFVYGASGRAQEGDRRG